MSISKRLMPRLVAPAMVLMVMSAAGCSSRGKGPKGIIDGRLAPCPGRPNCVSSEDDAGPSRIAALPFTGAPEAAWEDLKRAIQAEGGSIEREDDDYLWALFKTRLFRFVDDVEFRMDAPRRLIHVRSASRLGYSDLGANRKRVEALRRRFARASDR